MPHGGHHFAEKSITRSLNLLYLTQSSNSPLFLSSLTFLLLDVIVADELPSWLRFFVSFPRIISLIRPTRGLFVDYLGGGGARPGGCPPLPLSLRCPYPRSDLNG